MISSCHGLRQRRKESVRVVLGFVFLAACPSVEAMQNATGMPCHIEYMSGLEATGSVLRRRAGQLVQSIQHKCPIQHQLWLGSRMEAG